MMRRVLIGIIAALGLVVHDAAAQVTKNPTYLPPVRSFERHEFGAIVSFPGGGADAAFEGLYGLNTGAFDILFQGGFVLGAETSNSDLITFGTEFRFQVIDHNDDFPADGALLVGVGARLGDFNQAIIPAGLTLGRRLTVEDSEVSIVPFLQPTIVFIAGDRSDVGFAMGLGADFKLTRSFNLRVSAGLGEIDGISFSAIWLR